MPKELNYGPTNRKTFDLLTAADMSPICPAARRTLKRSFLQDVDLVGRQPRQGQLDMVEMDPVVAERGRAAAMVAEMAPPGPITGPLAAPMPGRAAARSSCAD